MIDVEVFGVSLAPEAPPLEEVRRLCTMAAARVGIDEAHVAIEFVDERRIAQLNDEYRNRSGPTDVLSFPIDGVGPMAGTAALPERCSQPASAQMVPRELGDVVICAQHTADLREAIVHGMLHLLGMDHDTDNGEMLALQRELLAGAGG